MASLSLKQTLAVSALAFTLALAVPRIKAGMDLRYFREQKRHKDELSRQSKLIEQKIKL